MPLRIVRIHFAFSNSIPNFNKALPNVLPLNKGIRLKYSAINGNKGSVVFDIIYGIYTITVSIISDSYCI